jgi:hypothetical protein
MFSNEFQECTTSGSSKQQQQLAGAVSVGANSRLSPLPTHKGIRKLTSFRNRSPTGQSPVNKTRKPSQTGWNRINYSLHIVMSLYMMKHY